VKCNGRKSKGKQIRLSGQMGLLGRPLVWHEQGPEFQEKKKASVHYA
jgi:hypothetical protein